MKSYLTEDNESEVELVKFDEVLESYSEDVKEEPNENFIHCEEITTETDLENDDMNIEYELVSYSCENCNVLFTTTEELELHIKDCSKETRAYSCGKCFKKFKYADTWKTHINLCSTVECDLCNKRFRTPGFLQV